MNLKILFFLYLTFCQIKAELKYNIVVPEFICDKSDEQDVKTDITTIGLDGEGKLDFKVTFKRMGKTCRHSQRCNLMAWKVIRDFETFLNNYPYVKSSSIEFKNTMLIPGLRYILNVFVTQGNTREQKQVFLNFLDDDSIRAAKKPLASIRLVGVPSSKAHMIYVLHAEVNMCSNISDYYFHWELLDESNNLLDRFVDRSSELNIPPFTFRDEKKYLIKCNLVNIENDEPFAKSTFSVNITNGDDPLVMKLPVVYTTVVVQQSINIRPYLLDLGNPDEDVKIEWSCIYNNTNMCENFDGDELNIEGGFLDEGEYKISLKVAKSSVVKSDFSLVRVMKDVPSIEMETVESPISSSAGITIKANVNELRTFCTLQWKMEEEFDFFKLTDVPGNVGELYNVTVKSDLFLKELEEFSSDVINKEFSLVIPPPSDTWTGLPNSGENYKLGFLLEVKCPKSQLQNNDKEIEYSEEMLNDTITVSALVNVDINVAPELQPLQVEPTTGMALQTLFTFQTERAVKNGSDYPLLYKFGYLLGDREFIFCNVLGLQKTESFLPYASDGVRTFLEVCDSSKSCGKTVGPTIKTSTPDIINEKMVLKTFKEKLNTEDFYKGFGYALSVLYTAMSLNEDDKFRQHFSDELFEKIQYLINSYIDDEEWPKRVNKLINNISEFNDELSFSEVVLNGLVELRGKLLAAQKEKLKFTKRQILGENKKATNLQNFKSYLEVSDLIITSSTDRNKIEFEKEHLRQKITEYMGRICMKLYEKQQKISLELKTVIFVVERLPKTSFNNFHIIPFDGNLWNTTAKIKLNADMLDKTGVDNLCVIKTTYKDFFNKSGVSYGATIVNGNDGKMLDNVESIILMPVDEQQIINKTPKCITYNNEWQPDCKFTKSFSKYAQCSCTRLGNFYLEYEDKTTITTTATRELLTESSITNQIIEDSNTVTRPSFDEVSSTKVERATFKLSPEEHLTTPMITLTTDVAENNAMGKTENAKEASTEVNQDTSLPSDLSHNNSINDDTKDKKLTELSSKSASIETPQFKGSESSSISTSISTNTYSTSNLNKNYVTAKGDYNLITQPTFTEIEKAAEILGIETVVATSLTSVNEVTEESVGLTTNKEADPSSSVTKSPDSNSDISITTENLNVNAKTSTHKVLIPVTASASLSSSRTDENNNEHVDSDVNIATSLYTPLILVTTSEKVLSEGHPENENVPADKDINGKIPTERVQTLTQFLTSPTSTVPNKNITDRKKLEDGRFRGGGIQGGIQANFNTGFSFNFFLNTTYK